MPDDLVEQGVEQRHVGAEAGREVHGRPARHRGESRVHAQQTGRVGPVQPVQDPHPLDDLGLAMLCPNRAIASAWSMSSYEPGWPSLPKDSFSASAAVAVHRRVLPSR